MAYLNGNKILFSPHVHIKKPDVVVKSWADVQAVVRDGKAKKVFSIGDQFKCWHSDYGVLTWDVIGVDHDIPSDPNYTHNLTLQLHECVPSVRMNMHNTDYDTWKDSFARDWLNKSGDDYVVPTYHSTESKTNVALEHSFSHNLDMDFLSVLGSVKKKTRSRDGESIDTTDDVFFLLSGEEVFAEPYGNYGLGEGAPYQYYIEMSQYKTPSSNNDSGRVKYTSYFNGTENVNRIKANGWGLRSPSGENTRAVFSKGQIGTTGASLAWGKTAWIYLSPACCIY